MTRIRRVLTGLLLFAVASTQFGCGKAGPPEGKLSLDRLDTIFAGEGFEVLTKDEDERTLRLIIDRKRQLVMRATAGADHAVRIVKVVYRVQAPMSDVMFGYFRAENSAVNPEMDSSGVSLSIQEFAEDGLRSSDAFSIKTKLGWIKSAAQDLDSYVIDSDRSVDRSGWTTISLNGGK